MASSEEANKGLVVRRLQQLLNVPQDTLAEDGSIWFKEDSYKNSTLPAARRMEFLLAHASKQGTGERGVPDFLVLVPHKRMAIVIECKGANEKHNPSGLDIEDLPLLTSTKDYITDYATSGAVWFASFLNRNMDIVAVAASGTSEEEFICTSYLLPRGESLSGAVVLEQQQPFHSALATPEDYENAFNEKFQRLSKEDEKALWSLTSYAKTCNNFLRANGISSKDRAGFLAAILLVLTVEDGTIFKQTKGIAALSKRPVEEEDTFGNDLPAILLKTLDEVWVRDEIPESKKRMLNQYYRGIIGQQMMHKPQKTGKGDIFPELNSFLASVIVSMYVNVFVPLKMNQERPKIDIMASFYTSFLKYAKGDAKDKGIVLTPRHICELFTDIAEWALGRKLDENTPVLDICCGTGSFLVAAMNRMDENIDALNISPTAAKEKKRHIREDCLLGVEYEPEMFALAYANMRFHGDGKSHLYCCSSLEKDMTTSDGVAVEIAGRDISLRQTFEALSMKPVVGMINPPYSLKADDSSELDFTLSLLDFLESGGVGITLVPISSACSRGSALRNKILKKHSLLACITLPRDLFHDSQVGIEPCIMVWRAGIPQAISTVKTFLARWTDDGFITIAHRGRVDANGAWAHHRREWLKELRDEKTLDSTKCVKYQIDMSMGKKTENGKMGPKADCVAEEYLSTDYSCITESDFIKSLKSYALYCYTEDIGELKSKQSELPSSVPSILDIDVEVFQTRYAPAAQKSLVPVESPFVKPLKDFYIKELFHVCYGINLEKAYLEPDSYGIAFVGRSAYNNGVTGYVEQLDDKVPQRAGLISVAGGGSVLASFVQRNPWYSGRDVFVLEPKSDMSLASKIFICQMISSNAGKFSYGRQANRFIPELCLKLPFTKDGLPDWNAIDNYMMSLPYSIILKEEKFQSD